MITAVVFDIGEALLDDTREWAAWADWLGVPRHTLSAVVGALVAAGRDNRDAFAYFRDDFDLERERAACNAAGGLSGVAVTAGDVLEDHSVSSWCCAVPATLDLDQFCADLDGRGVSRENWPERLEIVPDLPRGSGGKIAKARLRERLRR
jgi:acyl-CoA synthetase (AMP-forming)/AMP-acid ligase II